MVLARATLLLTVLGAAAAPQEREPEVAVALVPAAGKTIAAGESFWVAALFEIEDGWHVYWKNPGDSGAPTSVELQVPEGFRVGRGPLYPAPERVDLPAGMVSYAYEHETAVFFRVDVPEDAVEGTPIPLALEADWLVCKEVCFLGAAKARLELAVGASAEPRASSSAALERARGRLPLPYEGERSWGDGFRLEPETGKSVATLRLTCSAAVTDFFPDPSGGLTLRSVDISTDAGGSVVELVLETRTDPSEKRARGVLRARGVERDRFYEIDVPTPKEENR